MNNSVKMSVTLHTRHFQYQGSKLIVSVKYLREGGMNSGHWFKNFGKKRKDYIPLSAHTGFEIKFSHL